MAELERGARLSAGSSRHVPRTTVTNRSLLVERLPGGKGLRVTGEVDVASRDIWDGVLATLLREDEPGRLDLSGLAFIDVHGASALVETARRMAPARQLTLYRPPMSLWRALGLFWVGEKPLIGIEEDEEVG